MRLKFVYYKVCIKLIIKSLHCLEGNMEVRGKLIPVLHVIFLQLELAKLAGKSHKELSPIYVSLAITYSDLKCPADAINCYMEELETMDEDNYKEVGFLMLLIDN